MQARLLAGGSPKGRVGSIPTLHAFEGWIHDSTDMICTSQRIQTVIIDPPYNIGFRYDAVSDSMPWDEYTSAMSAITRNCLDKLTPRGSIFFMNYPETCARLLPHLESVGCRLHQWISWVYPSNMGHSSKRWSTSHRAILWMTSDECDQPYFDGYASPQPFRNPNDKRVRKRIAEGFDGVKAYDWWQINICKNVSKEHRGYSNQLPSAILERMILCTSREGDVILDPVAGSGSIIPVCSKHNRLAVVQDINPLAQEIWDSWGDLA